MCRRLGIIEVDYFGLQFTGSKGESLWLNLRNRISQQMDGLAPYRLKLRVKFFVEPHLILQEQTRYSGWHQPMSKGSFILIVILLYFLFGDTQCSALGLPLGSVLREQSRWCSEHPTGCLEGTRVSGVQEKFLIHTVLAFWPRFNLFCFLIVFRLNFLYFPKDVHIGRCVDMQDVPF